jgi:uncharacterized protein YutE (UPF0331/DUF86 family)
MDDVLLNKAASIERCINRINEEYSDIEDFKNNQTRQDAIILNLQRAIETVIDMGARVLRLQHLGIPQNSREIFVLLAKSQIISEELSRRIQKMVGFRNIAIHEYSTLNLEIVSSIIENHLVDIRDFSQIMLKL